jgi:ribosomal protein S11
MRVAAADVCELFAQHGDAGLHLAGAGAGQARRCAQRCLFAGRDAVRDADRGKVPFSGPNPFAVMNDRLLNQPVPPRGA